MDAKRQVCSIRRISSNCDILIRREPVGTDALDQKLCADMPDAIDYLNPDLPPDLKRVTMPVVDAKVTFCPA